MDWINCSFLSTYYNVSRFVKYVVFATWRHRSRQRFEIAGVIAGGQLHAFSFNFKLSENSKKDILLSRIFHRKIQNLRPSHTFKEHLNFDQTVKHAAVCRTVQLPVSSRGLVQPTSPMRVRYVWCTRYRSFSSFESCRYAPMVRVCHPLGDGISSLFNLLDSLLLRVAIWLVALVTCAGNAFVIVCRMLFHDEHNSHSLFIKYLAGPY